MRKIIWTAKVSSEEANALALHSNKQTTNPANKVEVIQIAEGLYGIIASQQAERHFNNVKKALIEHTKKKEQELVS